MSSDWTFRDPTFLWIGLLVLVGIALRAGTRNRPALRSGALALVPRDLTPSLRLRLRRLPRALEVTALVALTIAVARPVARLELPRQREGIDILLLADRSSSMVANDLDKEATRLDVARNAARLFVEAREFDRIGLVSFARYADLNCPVTLDHEAMLGFLDGLRPVAANSAEDLTGIGTAIARAGQALRESTAKSRVLVVLTDGEENVATERTPEEIGPLEAAELCARFGIRAHTIAIGRGKQARDGSFEPIDTSTLEEVAKKTGGQFFKATDDDALVEVYRRIDELERTVFEEPRFQFEERFAPFLFAGLLLLLLSRALRLGLTEVWP